MVGAYAPGYAIGSPEYRRLLLALVCAGVATFAQIYSPQGMLQLIAADLRIGAEGAALSVSAATAGLALAVLPWSFVGDRWGRRPAMMLSVVSATALALISAWAPSYELMLALRFLEGVALGGVPALAVAYLSEEVHPRARAVAAGWYVAGTTIGGLSGRMLATPVADLTSWRMGMSAVAVLAGMAAAGFVLLAPAERRFTVTTGRGSARTAVSRVVRAVRDPGQLALLGFAFLMMGGFVSVYNYLSFHLTAPPYLVPAALIGLVFLAYLGGTVASPLAGRLAAEHGRLPMMLTMMGVMVMGLLLTLTGPLLLVLLGLLVLTAGFFGAHAIASGWAGARAEGARSQATGLYNLAYYLGSSVLGWGTGLVYEAGGWTLTVLVVALAVVLSAVLVVVMLRERQ
ncbi:MFS transporter [Brachybacterium sp.]|uniref:MFS transporter n=1 Tax=Brachybacterium sp. TaxID=1891286 RepID=UPI002ED451D8